MADRIFHLFEAHSGARPYVSLAVTPDFSSPVTPAKAGVSPARPAASEMERSRPSPG